MSTQTAAETIQQVEPGAVSIRFATFDVFASWFRLWWGREPTAREVWLYIAARTSEAPAPTTQQQAEPAADERAAFEAWQREELPSHHGSDYSAADVEFNCYEAALAAWLARGKISARAAEG